MTHHISGFVGPEDHLKAQTRNLTNAKVISLSQGMAFLPLGDDLYKEVLEFSRHPMLWLANKFKPIPFAWIETDYFGGGGEQSAILWRGDKKRRFRDRCGFNPIDNAMRELGVVCEGDKDEFDTLGLGKYRTNESWLGTER